jgi:hypothetical protein
MHRLMLTATLLGGLMISTAGTAAAGPVRDQFGAGVFGLPWSAGKSAIQTKYPGGTWDKDDKGRDRYCAASRQSLLKLPAQHQTKELCFLIGTDGTLGSATAKLDASLPTLLAVVNRSRTMFGDFDMRRREEGTIISKWSAQLWTRDAPYVVQVWSANDDDGRPVEVAFTVADEANLYTEGAARVSNRPTGQ